MSNCTKITLVANAGVFVEHNDVGILVDGIHHEYGHPFSRVSEKDLLLMRQGADIFVNLDYLLFTHEHPDHLTPHHVLEHLHCRTVKGLFLPNESNGTSNLVLLLNRVRKLDIPYWSLGLEPGEIKRFPLTNDLTVTVLGTHHMGKQYTTIRNNCFLLSLAGKNLLFTGDADHVAEHFESALKDVVLDAVFVNPIFYHNSKGQEIIGEIFRPKNLVIYHMPFEHDDTMRFSYMVDKDIEKHGCPEIQTHVLRCERQSISLSVSVSE